jgi:antitoxin (DNA-binding transcriptional repressor) of toxin-antitoxin stability system
MSTGVVQVGVREFREELARYLESDKPLAITRHGRTLGFYIPLPSPDPRELEALRRGVEQLEALLREQGITEDEIVCDFQALRRSSR